MAGYLPAERHSVALTRLSAISWHFSVSTISWHLSPTYLKSVEVEKWQSLLWKILDQMGSSG